MVLGRNMDALMKAVKRSPRPFSRSSGSTAKRHEKLADKWGEEKEPVKEGVTFYLKLVGSTLVEELTEEGASYGDSISAAAVQTIVNMAKLNGKKKLPKMALTVSTKGIRVVNMATKDVKQDVTIYRISFCTADKAHDKIFAYVARNTENETMECHAFLCPKRKIAQAVTLTVAQAFNVAQEEWEAKQVKEEQNKNTRALSAQVNNENTPACTNGSAVTNNHNNHHPAEQRREPGLISFDESPTETPPIPPRYNVPSDVLESSTNSTPPVQMGFDDNFVEEDEFSSLAQSRSGPVSGGGLTTQPDDPFGSSFSPFTNPFQGRQLQTGLRAEDLDEGVEQLLQGQTNPYHLPRQPSIDDLLSL